MFSEYKTSIIAGILSGALAGLAEAVFKSFVFSYYHIMFFTSGLLYYAPVGIVIAIMVASILLLFEKVLGKGFIKHREIIVFSSTFAYLFSPTFLKMVLRSFISVSKSSNEIYLLLSILIILNFLLGISVWWFIRKASSIMTPFKNENKPLFLYIFVLVILIFVSVLSSPDSVTEAQNISDKNADDNMPNIIFIIFDACRYDCVSYDGDEIDTPTLYGLSRDGIAFKNAFSHCGWTKPSIASMVTSLYPVQHKITTPHRVINPELPLLAESLNEAGYYTAGFYNNAQLLKSSNFHLGFQQYNRLFNYKLFLNDLEGPWLVYLNSYEMILRYLFGVHLFNSGEYQDAESTTDTVIEWITSNHDKKFFLFAHYMDPHGPYYYHPYDGSSMKPPQKPQKKQRTDIIYTKEDVNRVFEVYKGEVSFSDKSLGRLFEFLKESDLYSNTMIIFTADHGEEFNEHGSWSHGNGVYDELIHVPLIIKLPGSEREGTVDSSLVQLIDLAPTILEYIDWEVPNGWEGINIFGEEKNDVVFAYDEAKKNEKYAFRLLKEKLILTREKNTTNKTIEFYNMEDDPLEQINLAENPEYKSRVDSLMNVFLAFEEKLSLKAVESIDTKLDEKTIENLKALGYLE